MNIFLSPHLLKLNNAIKLIMKTKIWRREFGRKVSQRPSILSRIAELVSPSWKKQKNSY